MKLAVTLTLNGTAIPAVVELDADAVAQIATYVNTPPYLTVNEAADYLRCDRHRIYDLLSAGRLTRYKEGTRVLVRRDEVEAHLTR